MRGILSHLELAMRGYRRRCADTLRDAATKGALRVLRLANQCKDRALAAHLHQIADEYDPRPTGRWE